MRARQLLPAALALAGLVVLSACGDGDGLRVEGAEPAPSVTTPTSATRGFGPQATPTPKVAAPVTVSLPAVRKALLADKLLDAQSRMVLTNCTVIDRCLTRGATVDALRTGKPQVVVLIHTIDDFTFSGFLIAVEPSGPRRVWSFKGQQLKIIPAANGDLVVESELFNLDDKPCCPSGKRVEVYRWDGRQMTTVKTQDQKGD